MLSRVNIGGGGGSLGDPTSGMAIIVKYPVGGECTCTNGTKTFRSKDTVGACIFYVPSTGAWTLTAALDGNVTSQTVNVTGVGVHEVTLAFEYILFNSGINRLGAQGTWTNYAGGHNYTVSDTYIEVQGRQNGGPYGLYSALTFDITDYDYLTITGTFTRRSYNLQVGVCTTNPEKAANAGIIGSTILSTSHEMTDEVVATLTGYSGQKYLFFKTYGDDGSVSTVVNILNMTKISLTKAS